MNGTQWTTEGETHGFLVIAADGAVGSVERLPASGDTEPPAFVVVRVGGWLRRRFPVIPSALVDHVDRERRLVWTRATRAQIRALPEHLPLAI